MFLSDPVPFAVPDIGEREIAAVVDAMRSGWLTTGPQASAFETEFARYLGGDCHALAVNSATSGLHLALESLGVRAGDEVIVPTWTFTATAEVVRYLGAEPIIVDIDPATLNLDLQAAATAVTERTRAVIPVHFAGLAADPSATSDFARRHGLRVIDDAAHAFPCRTGSRLIGVGTADATVFSFYATKTITTGEGGMVVSADADLVSRMRTMRLHGISRDVFARYGGTEPAWRYDVVAPGFKYNLTDTAAAMGRVQLTRAVEMRDRRAMIAYRYQEAFADLSVRLPTTAPVGDSHAWHLYVLRLNDESPIGRDDLISRLAERRIGTSVHFIPLHLQPYWRDRYSLVPEQFPVATAEFQRVVSLPMFSAMSDLQVDRVIDAVREALG